MGILARPLELMNKIKLRRGFKVAELGDQYITAKLPRVPASTYYEKRGCGLYQSIDGNGRGTITWDLNRPIRFDQVQLWGGPFDLVTDFGTGEHVFDQAAVWRSIHCLTKIGGYIAFDRPTQGYIGHCFYNCHRGLFEDIAHANRYEVVALEEGTMPRGKLVRGIFRRTEKGKFVAPQQGRYQKSLRKGGIIG